MAVANLRYPKDTPTSWRINGFRIAGLPSPTSGLSLPADRRQISMKINKMGALIRAVAIWVLPVAGFAGLSEGQRMYEAYCQVCHGEFGQGQAMGKSLTDSASSSLGDRELIDVIANGRPGTGMAAWSGSFSDEEVFDVASYVRVLQGGPGLAVESARKRADDPEVAAGEEVFRNVAGCISCHSYGSEGGGVGPALDGVGGRLDDNELLEALLDPSATVAEGYGAKVIEQDDGTRIVGRYRNDNDLTVQVLSPDGKRWRTFFKSRVRAIADSPESLMPEVFASLAEEERRQLLAFLRSL